MNAERQGMQEHEWNGVQDWFRGYGAGFLEEDGRLHPLLQVKARHSRRVAANARDIAHDLGYDRAGILHVQTAGLLHDVGRFSQFREYRTFSDHKSIDHGERGFSVLSADESFGNLQTPNRADLLASVRYHNRLAIPDTLTASERRLTEIVRDADKLDIFKVVLDAVESGEYEKNESIFMNKPPDGPPNPVIVDSIRQGKTASYEHIRNRTDFGLQLLSWAFDFVFDATCRRLVERGLFDAMMARLPDEPDTREAAAITREHLMLRCQ